MLRAGVGIEKYQIHNFDCHECELPITVAVRSNAPNAHFEAEDNIMFCGELVDNYTVINLHPNFAFTKETLHNERAFPSIEYNQMITPHLRLVEGKHQDTALQFDIPNTKGLWGSVKNIYTLQLKSGKEKLLKKAIENYENQRNKYVKNSPISTTDEVFFNFFDSLLYPRVNQLLNPVLEIVEDIKKNYSAEFSRYKSFFETELKDSQYKRNILIFSDFFKIHSQLSQVMVHARLGDENVDDKIVGSKSFEEVKLYYGQAYETLTSSFVTLACLNNIKDGRKFDEFNSMTLNKYIKDVKKEGKSKPFSNTPELNAFASGLESMLRNGSHHASIWRDGDKVYYRSGGTGQERDMTYAMYLHMCNKLTISLAALWLLDLNISNG